MRKHSFRFKITLFLTISISLTIILCWVLNRSFLERYYEYSKKIVLKEVYHEVNEYLNEEAPTDDSAADVGTKADDGSVMDQEEQDDDSTDSDIELSLDDEQISTIDRLEVSNNVKIYILYSRPYQYGLRIYDAIYTIYPTMNRMDDQSEEDGYNTEKRELNQILLSMRAYTFPNGNNPDITDIVVLDIQEKYGIFTQHNVLLESNYMDLYGELNNRVFVVVRTNLESIQEAVSISNKFLGFIGIFVIICGSIVAYFFSNKFSKPIVELSKIAKKMSELNFNIKYPVKTKDEIGELGNSINNLSERLETTISELKTANIELLSDIEKKTEIDEMRKDFLSNVTHELKTPIALIQGYAEGLKDNINDDQESRDFYCEVIMDEAMKMNTMVKKLLTLNQIEFGNNQLEITRFDIISLITSVLNATDILVKQKEVTVHFEEKEPIYVWADEYMIEEVLTNYISNALNHADDAKIMEVKLVRKDNILRVAVFNTGEQIPEEDINNIWIKFYKVDKARTREYGGNGIGLSIVKAIMDSHNKECGVKNHDTGVEFWFELDASEE